MLARERCLCYGRTSGQEHVFLILAVLLSALLSLNAQTTVTSLETNSSSSNISTSPQPMSTNAGSSCDLCRINEYCNATLTCRRCMEAISGCTNCSTVMTSVKCFTCDSGLSLHPDGSRCGEDSQTMYIIIGCVIGGFVLIVVLVAVITCCVLKHRRPSAKKQPQPPPTKADLEQYPTTYENIVVQSAPTTDELNQGHDIITRYSRDPTVVKKEKRQSAFMQKFRRKSKHSEAAATVTTATSSSSYQPHPGDLAAGIEEQNYDNDVTVDGLPDEICYDNHDVLNSSNPPLPLPVTSHSSDSSSDDDEEEVGKPKKPDYVNVDKLGADYVNVPNVKKSASHTNKQPDYVNEDVIAQLARMSGSTVDYLPMDGPDPVASVGGALADDRRRGARLGNSGREAPRRGHAEPDRLAQSELALNYGASGQKQARGQLRRPSQQQANRY